MTYGNDNVEVNVYLSPVPGAGQAFDTVLYLVDEAQGTGNGLNGDRYRTYNSITDAQADQTAGYISDEVLAALGVVFEQKPRPKTVLVGRVDTVGGESYAGTSTDALELVIAAGANFYGIAIDSVTAADILAVNGAIETLGFYLFAAQSTDTDWYGGSWPATFSAMEDDEQTFVCFHDGTIVTTTDPAMMALGYICDRLRFDVDSQSVGWPAKVDGIPVYTAALTSSQKTNAEANHVNLLDTYGAVTTWVGGGWNCAGRPIDHILTKDWFATRLKERIIQFVQEKSQRGEKIVIGSEGQTASDGQTAILAIINGLLLEGEAANHFVKGQTASAALAITAADITNERMRFDVEAQFETNARRFTFNCYFGTSAVNE